MGKLAKILSFVRVARNGVPSSDVTADTGGGFNVTAVNSAPPGDDSQPLADDYTALMPDSGTGREIAVGYMDPVNEPVAGPGEKRIYARDASTGVYVSEVWLKSDGSVHLINGAGSIVLLANGSVTINGVTVDTSGNITTGGAIAAPSVVAAGLELAGHTHAVTTAPGTTGPNQ